MTDAAPMHTGPSAEASTVRGSGVRVAIVAARFNGAVVDLLVGGAVECLREHGVADEDVAVYRVPGAFELPLAAKRAAATGRFDAVVCVGAVIRGETPHFGFVAAEAARGIQQVALACGIPVAFGVLTTDTVEQAQARAGGAHGNKGWESALSALEMVKMLDDLDGGGGPEDR
jgi:6,7-dimethyl-8-ribityllumazine synthase